MPALSNPVDFCILGAGIAGLSLADALLEKGFSVAVLEKNEIGSGASGSPGALVNPATGRRAKKSWKAEQCYHSIRANLEKIASFSSDSFYRNNGLLRPALLEKMARKMRKQYDTTHWPDGWCQWLTEAQIKERHPGIKCVDGGLWLPIGLTVDIQQYLNAYANYLRSQDVFIKTQNEPHTEAIDDGWLISNGESNFKSNQLIFATGYGTSDHPYWNFIPLEGVKGQLAKFKVDEPLSFDHSISSLGYIVRFDDEHTFIQGSTYEHDFEHLNTDAEGEAYLRKRMARTLPKLAEKAELVDQWAGVRLFTPDKKPVLGPHPEIENLHIFSALGSKGLMYGKFLAEHYAHYLTNGQSIFPEVSVERF